MTDKLPEKTSPSTAVNAFLRKANTLPAQPRGQVPGRGRLIYAMDATASRQPSWDSACQLQGEMFMAAERLGGLQVQLCFYRGLSECRTSAWHDSPAALLHQMAAVRCLGGYTQLRKVLKHALRENKKQRVDALVFVGDALEEAVDDLCQLAGECGLQDLPLFLFQEGGDPKVENAFRQMAKLSKGAYARFDSHSADQLAALLRAVATYASGGREALGKLDSGTARQLLTQL